MSATEPPAIGLEVAVGVAGLPEAGPARRLALHRAGAPAEVWSAVCAGRASTLPGMAAVMGRRADVLNGRWAAAARAGDLPAEVARHRAAGVGLAVLGTSTMPGVLASDIEPPSLLCLRGDPDVVVGPRVAIVGTRRCTRYGREVATELGYDLAAAGIAVVSGLAAGIDAAAHRGALEAGGAPPIGVVGTGLDVVYPRQHAALWQQVAEAGVLLSEHLLGTPPRAWHFPSRNRLLAALADIVVVVESDRSGGSMHTVDEAEARQRVVMAVPGPVRSRASAGTNGLLRERAHVITDATDVLILLGMSPAATRSAVERRPTPSPEAAAVLAAMGWEPAAADDLVRRTGRTVATVAVALDELERDGWISRSGGWYERRAKPE